VPRIPNVLLWHRSDLGISLNGANVSDIADQVGSADLQAPGAGNQPLFVASGPLGLPTVRFTGASMHYLEGPAVNTLFASTAFSLWVVCSASVTAGMKGIIGAQSAAPRFYLWSDSASYDVFDNLMPSGATGVTVRRLAHDGADALVYEDGALIDSTTIALSPLSSAKFTIGWTGGQFLHGDWYETIGVLGNVPPATAAEIDRQLALRYL
jgi:hypothetical protein